MVNLWNQQVNPGDFVYHLGDFSFLKKEATADILKRLNGQKFLIKGNHDSSETLDYLLERKLIVGWEHYKEIDLVDYDGTKHKTCMFHFPMVSWHKQHYGSFHLHGHCVDMQTEILTKNGWKKRNELNVGDAVISYNTETMLLEHDTINQIIDRAHAGDVYSFAGKSANFRVTDEHVMLSRDFLNKPIKVPAKEIGRTLYFTSSGHVVNAGIDLTDDMLKLYILMLSDGSIKEETQLCRIRVKKEHKKEYIRHILLNLGLNAREIHKNGYVSFNFHIPYVLWSYRIKGMDKRILRCNETQAASIYEAYCHSDGHKPKNSKTLIIYSAKEREIDLLQAMFVQNGFHTKKYSRYHGFGTKLQHQLSVTKSKSGGFRSVMRTLKQEHVENENFWCVTTRNQTFVQRREGCVSVTGNCHGNLAPALIRGRMLDVGLDNAIQDYGNAFFFTEEDIINNLMLVYVEIAETHRSEKEPR